MLVQAHKDPTSGRLFETESELLRFQADVLDERARVEKVAALREDMRALGVRLAESIDTPARLQSLVEQHIRNYVAIANELYSLVKGTALPVPLELVELQLKDIAVRHNQADPWASDRTQTSRQVGLFFTARAQFRGDASQFSGVCDVTLLAMLEPFRYTRRGQQEHSLGATVLYTVHVAANLDILPRLEHTLTDYAEMRFRAMKHGVKISSKLEQLHAADERLAEAKRMVAEAEARHEITRLALTATQREVTEAFDDVRTKFDADPVNAFPEEAALVQLTKFIGPLAAGVEFVIKNCAPPAPAPAASI